MVNNYLTEAVKDSVYIHPSASTIVKNTGSVAMFTNMENNNGGRETISPFKRVSEFHGRSFEDVDGLILDQTTITDEYDDIYTQFSIKGAGGTAIRADYQPIEPSNVKVNGLMDSSLLYRVTKVSELLRKQGILTEWPIYHSRPKRIYLNEDKIGLQQLRKSLYDDYVERAEHLRDNSAESPIPVGIVGSVGQGLSELEIGVMYRACLSNARIGDITIIEPEQIETRIKAAIESLQLRKPVHFSSWSGIEKLDADNPVDKLTYLKEILPSIIAENYAWLHGIGAYHKYSHVGNISLAGEIVDQDSILIPKLFEEDADGIAPLSKIVESMQVIEVVSETLSEIVAKLEIDSGNVDVSIDDVREKMRKSMRSAYYAERILSDDLEELDEILLESFYYDQHEGLQDGGELGEPKILDMTSTEFEKVAADTLADLLEGVTEQGELSRELYGFTLFENTQSSLYKYIYREVENRLKKLNNNIGLPELVISEVAKLEHLKATQVIGHILIASIKNFK